MRDDEPTAPADPHEQSTTDPKYDDWPIDDERFPQATYIGVAGGGVPVYHGEGTVFHGEVDETNREITPIPESEREVTVGPRATGEDSSDAGDTLAAVIEDIGDTLGWESLSAYGEKHRSGGDDR